MTELPLTPALRPFEQFGPTPLPEDEEEPSEEATE